MHRHYGLLLRHLHSCLDQAMTAALASMDLTAAQGHIMGFIAHRKTPPCPKDIEDTFHLSHPTVSGLLARLEKKGFLEFRQDTQDRRCKRIHMLPKSREVSETMRNTMASMEEQLVSGFTQEEKDQFYSLLCRAIENLGPTPCCRKEKEETNQ